MKTRDAGAERRDPAESHEPRAETRAAGAEHPGAAWVVRPDARALAPVPGAPRLSGAACEPLREIQILDEQGQRRRIHIPAERPLTVILDDRELVTLMTLGAAPELLVLGYLRNQRIVADARQIESIAVDWAAGVAAVRSRSGADDGRVAAVGAACGLGTSFRDLMTRPGAGAIAPAARISRRTLLSVLDTMRQYDAIHRAAGSVHSCALFRGADLWLSVEDVSRHNGLDTVAGWMGLHGAAGGDKIIFTTGRLTGEMVMKAAYNGVPVIISRNGVTALGHALAAQQGMILFGRAANHRFLCYAGAERFDTDG